MKQNNICKCGHLKSKHYKNKYFCTGKMIDDLYVDCECLKFRLKEKTEGKK